MNIMKPKIGISLRITNAQNYVEKRDSISHDWPVFLEQLGFSPLLIPNTISDIPTFLDEMKISGLILSGGDNIGENKNRDETENLLLKLAIEKRIPDLGVCRGMQLINNYFGGDMSIDNTTEHISKNHDVEITDKSFFSLFNSDKITVNSFHKNTIQIDQVGQNLNPFAISNYDKTVEGFFHSIFPIIGVMWHPERTKVSSDDIILTKIFENKVFWKEKP